MIVRIAIAFRTVKTWYDHYGRLYDDPDVPIMCTHDFFKIQPPLAWIRRGTV
jgi:hypothetical protein